MRRVAAACVASLLLAMGVPVVAHAAPTIEHVTLTNPGDPDDPNDDQDIVITVFQPETASPDNQVPVILHSHGWGGRRSKTASGDIGAFLNAGMGVVSIDQRGHGDSGGTAYVQDPDREAEDIQMVIDHIATLDWVLHDSDENGTPIENDPVLGAVGGSYGGGYQTMTTLDEIQEDGRTRMNALAPEITWYDLPESLAPQGAPRTAWTALLYAAGARMLPQYVHEAQLWGTTTGQWPDGTVYGEPVAAAPNLDQVFHENSPIAFAERGVKIDIPVVIKQGTSDNLFNLNQGLDIFHKAVTDEARDQSYFVAFNGGHALPNVLPPGRPVAAEIGGGKDACIGDAWTQFRIDFFRTVFAGAGTEGLLDHRYNFTDLSGETCTRFDAIDNSVTVDVDPLGAGGAITTTGLGAPLHLEVAEGPVTVTGVPELSGTVAAAGLDSRAFFGLSTGVTPADARVVQNNLMPLRQILPTAGDDFEIELPGVAVDVPEGQKLFLTISPLSDMYFAHGSRTPGGLVLTDLQLTLPKPGMSDGEDPVAAPTQMTLVVEGRGSSSRLVATLAETSDGSPIEGAQIDFFADGDSLGDAVTNSDGEASLPLEGRYRSRRHTFEAVFGGTDEYEGSSASTEGRDSG